MHISPLGGRRATRRGDARHLTFCAVRSRVLIKQRLRALTAHDAVRHLVRMPLVRIADLTDATLELHAASLLDHVRRFVGHGVQVRALTEHDVIARRVRVRAHLARARGCLTAHVRLDTGDVVPPECALDLIGERQLCCRRGHAACSRGVDVGRVASRPGDGRALDAKQHR